MFSRIPKTSISNIALRYVPVVKDDVSQKDIPQQLKLWEKFDWPPEREQAMYVEWGVHCSRKQNPDRAEDYYKFALNLRESDANALYHLSYCQRQMAKTKPAFENSKKARLYETRNPRIDREYCRCLYQMNEFEVAKAKASEISRKYNGSQGQNFKQMCQTFDHHINDCFGQPYNDFVLKHQSLFPEIISANQKKNNQDPRPLWKVLKEQEKCDVVSVLEKEALKFHPREVARRKLASKVFHQVYLPNSWKDALYQRDLEKNNDCLSSVFRESTPALRKLLQAKNDAVNQFVKILHARSPLYHEQRHKLKNKKISDLMHEKHLNRVQYKTRRNMFDILRRIKSLRARGDIDELAKLVEKSMGDIIILKTRRVAPWKREFTHEVYNTLALAILDKYVIPTELVDSLELHALEALFQIQPPAETLTPIGFVFGNKATQIDPNSFNQVYEKKRKFLERMEKRLDFTKDSIEKGYIYHEMARAHYKTGSFRECELVAMKGVKEASQTSDTMVWALLCMLLIIKCNISTSRREKCGDALEAARSFAQCLNCWRLVDFLDQAQIFNSYKTLRYKSQSQDLSELRRSKSRSADSAEETPLDGTKYSV